MRIQTLWLPKAGHGADEYEDAFGASDAASFPFRAVVADGATESAFSGGWARLLAAEYLRMGDLVEASASARALFNPEVGGRWYVQAKAAQGAHAALLGLELEPGLTGNSGRPGTASRADDPTNPRSPGNGKIDGPGEGAGTWRAESVGDCCLFHVQDGYLHGSWPYADAADFHHRPSLISSLESSPEVMATSGSWTEGDAFILATDALAAWLLEAGVEALLRSDDFERLVKAARRGEAAGAPEDSARPRIRDDDTTAVIIHV